LEVGLLVGRFQPFHLGHLFAIKFALDQVDFLYIAIGSAQKSHQLDDPFTAGERIRMVKGALDEDGIDCHRWLAIPVPDAPAHSIWVATVESLVSGFSKVFTNDPLTKRLFVEHGTAVVENPLYMREKMSATEVRRRILDGRIWDELVPKSVVKVIDEVGGIKRLKSLVK
jgi:nicotinamide-nucleotide adenylyltransferase